MEKEMAEKQDRTPGEELLAEGRELQKIEVGPEQFYQTAIKVQQPRNLTEIRQACLREAEFAGELFYYQWQVTDKKGNKREVDGVTIHGAMAIARNFGNCAVPVSVETELDGSAMFKAAFVDLERGFTVARNFRAHFVPPPGKFAKDPAQTARWYDMQFQKAQSQAQRNVILKGVPYWLVDLVKKTAKDSAYAEIKRIGVDKARKAAIGAFSEQWNVQQEDLEAHLGKKAGQWTIRDLVSLKSILRAFEEGIDSPETMFGAESNEEGQVNQKEIADEFWAKLAKRKIIKGDPEVVEYVKGCAAFAKVSVVSYLADLVAAFSDEIEINRFLERFNKKKEKGEIKPPEDPVDDIPF